MRDEIMMNTIEKISWEKPSLIDFNSEFGTLNKNSVVMTENCESEGGTSPANLTASGMCADGSVASLGPS